MTYFAGYEPKADRFAGCPIEDTDRRFEKCRDIEAYPRAADPTPNVDPEDVLRLAKTMPRCEVFARW